MKAYVWAWRHYVLGVDEHESLDDAVRASFYASEAGDEAIDCIEVPAEGRVYSKEEVFSLWEPLEQAERERWRSLPQNVAVVEIASPDGRHRATWRGFATREVANASAETLQQVFADRVSVRDVR